MLETVQTLLKFYNENTNIFLHIFSLHIFSLKNVLGIQYFHQALYKKRVPEGLTPGNKN